VSQFQHKRGFSQLPKVDRLLHEERLKALSQRFGREVVLEAVRDCLARHRARLRTADITSSVFDTEQWIDEIIAVVEEEIAPRLKRVINATGIVLHTNLGRAPLSKTAQERVHEISTGYCNLEYDLATHRRHNRLQHVEWRLRRLTGAEDVLLVNNNAAAVWLALNSRCDGRELIISRGELIEIGDGFRLPDIMKKAGVKLVEVGTTNVTTIDDYAAGVTPKTAAMMKVHRSNFSQIGYTKSVAVDELIALARRHELDVICDVGSGHFRPDGLLDPAGETLIPGLIKAGIDLVTFSCDKWIGGPQAGAIIGQKKSIETLRGNPLVRTLRLDKFSLAALEGTLIDGADERMGYEHIPSLRLVHLPPQKQLASIWLRAFEQPAGELGLMGNIVPDVGYLGGGVAEKSFPTYSLEIRHKTGIDRTLRAMDLYLTSCRTPIVGRLENGRLLLSVGTILSDDEGQYVSDALRDATPEAVSRAFKRSKDGSADR